MCDLYEGMLRIMQQCEPTLTIYVPVIPVNSSPAFYQQLLTFLHSIHRPVLGAEFLAVKGKDNIIV